MRPHPNRVRPTVDHDPSNPKLHSELDDQNGSPTPKAVPFAGDTLSFRSAAKGGRPGVGRILARGRQRIVTMNRKEADMSQINHAVIMAAGRGTRMNPVTSVIPKPMMPLLGSTLIANGISKINPHIANIHITVGYKGATLAEHVIQHGVSSVFNTDGRGNAWWLYNTLLRHLDEPTFVLTCDNVCELDFAALASDYFDLGSPPCMVVPVAPVVGLDGDFIVSDDRQVVQKLDRNDPSDRYCSGIQIVHPGKINRSTSPTEDFNEVWAQLIRQEAMMCSRFQPRTWYSVDTLDQLQQVNDAIALQASE